MKTSYSILIFTGIFAFLQSDSSFGNDYTCRKASATIQALPYYWTTRSVGEDPYPERRKAGAPVEHYFVGDPIRGRLFLASECHTAPLSREDLGTVPACLYLEVYDIMEGWNGYYQPRTKKPIYSASLSFLKTDDNDKWNIENKSKKEFISYRGYSEGLETESFTISGVFGKDLPAGKYLLKLVVKQKECPIYVLINGSRRLVIIHDPDTTKLKALKLCHEAGLLIKNKWKDAVMRKRVIEEKIYQALDIYPESICAHSYLAYYFWLKRNKEKFIEHYKASCDAQVYKGFRDPCLYSFKYKLDRWDNPESWGMGK